MATRTNYRLMYGIIASHPDSSTWNTLRQNTDWIERMKGETLTGTDHTE